MKSKSDQNSESDDCDPVEEPTGACKVPTPKQPFLVNIADIVLGNGGREIDDRKVKQLERSIVDQGLHTPIQLYELGKGKFGLAAGQHRLRAVKNLGWQSVPAVVITRKEAKAWRASENLHRNDLNELQKSLEIVNYAAGRQELPSVKSEIPIRDPNAPCYQQLLPYLMASPDLPVPKNGVKVPVRELTINGGLHFHGVLVLPPEDKCRLGRHLLAHLHEKESMYCPADLPLLRIDARPSNTPMLADYALKQIKRGNVDYDDLLILPRSRSEVSR